MSATISKTQQLSVEEIAANLNAAGIPPKFGENHSRILVKNLRVLAQGNPITKAGTIKISEELKLPFEQVDEFLRGLPKETLMTILSG